MVNGENPQVIDMGQPTYDTIEVLLASVQQEIEDPELTYKLRTARQLLLVYREQNLTYRDTLEGADLDDETTERLVELGYL